MSYKAINLRELRKMHDLNGAEWTVSHLSEALRAKTLRPENFSIRDLAEALVDNGSEYLRLIDPRRKGGGMNLTEAANAVDTSAFSNITGQIVYNKILDGYTNPEFLWPQLVETIPTTFLEAERFAGIGGIGDEAEVVEEGAPYPMVGLNEEYVDGLPTKKYGMIVPVTREAIVADRTGVLLKRAAEVGHYLGIRKEKIVLNTVTGQTGYNSYVRNGVSTNTYQTSGSYINSQGNTLVDHTDVENAELLLAAITDPNTGEPIMNVPNAILVPLDLKKTVERILHITSVGVVDNSATTATARQYSDGPEKLYGGKLQYTVLSNAYVKSITSSASTWWLGDFKKAFGYREAWQLQVQQAGAGTEADFTQDIVVRYKADYRGREVILNPRFVAKNT